MPESVAGIGAIPINSTMAKYKYNSDTGKLERKPPRKTKLPLCKACYKPLPLMVAWRRRDDRPRRGAYGDGLVCSLACGHILMCRLVASIPGVLDLLPSEWRTKPTKDNPLLIPLDSL